MPPRGPRGLRRRSTTALWQTGSALCLTTEPTKLINLFLSCVLKTQGFGRRQTKNKTPTQRGVNWLTAHFTFVIFSQQQLASLLLLVSLLSCEPSLYVYVRQRHEEKTFKDRINRGGCRYKDWSRWTDFSQVFPKYIRLSIDWNSKLEIFAKYIILSKNHRRIKRHKMNMLK